MSKQALIDSIRQRNPSAAMEFLTKFTHAALEKYLSHLQVTQRPRNFQSAWVRIPETPAIMGRARRQAA